MCFAQVSLLKIRVYGEKLDTFRQRGRNFYVSSFQINAFGLKFGTFFATHEDLIWRLTRYNPRLWSKIKYFFAPSLVKNLTLFPPLKRT